MHPMQPNRTGFFSTPDFLPLRCLCGNFECWTSCPSPWCVILLMAILILFVSWKIWGNTNIGLSILEFLLFSSFIRLLISKTIEKQNNETSHPKWQMQQDPRSKHQEIRLKVKSKIYLFIWIHDRRRKEHSVHSVINTGEQESSVPSQWVAKQHNIIKVVWRKSVRRWIAVQW